MSERPITIRQFSYADDWEDVRNLWATAGPGIHLGRSDTPEEILKKLQRDPDLFLVAKDADRIVGAVVGGFDGRRGLVYHLAVGEDFRQQGIGELLMGELEQRLRAKGCLRCYLLVTRENIYAMRFYEKRGWVSLDNLALYGKDLV